MISLLMIYYRKFSTIVQTQYSQVILLFFGLLAYSTTGYMYFELPSNPDLSWLDALWWSLVTMTTVGYGDFFPTSAMGRILIGFPTMFLGVGLLGYILSLVASAMLSARIMEARGMKAFMESGHIVICNFGSLEKTSKLIQELRRDASTEDAAIVIVDDRLQEIPAELVEGQIYFVKGEPTREAILEKANIAEAKAVIVQAVDWDLANSDNHNLKLVLTIDNLAPSTNIVVECIDPENEVFFRRANCDSVVCISSLAGQMLVQELQDPGVGTIVSELTSNALGRQFYVVNIGEATGPYKNIQGKYTGKDMILLGIRRNEDNIILPDPDFQLCQGDKAILVAASRPV